MWTQLSSLWLLSIVISVRQSKDVSQIDIHRVIQQLQEEQTIHLALVAECRIVRTMSCELARSVAGDVSEDEEQLSPRDKASLAR